jgi:hypothetical protein
LVGFLSTVPSVRTTIGSSPGSGAKRAKQRRGVAVFVGIDHPEGNAVASEEVRQPRHVRGLDRPDEDRASESDLDQRYAAEDERAQDALAQLGLRDEQRPQRLRRNDDRLDVTHRPGVEYAQVRPSGELSDLGDDLARDHLRHLLQRSPDHLRERVHRHRLPQPVARLDRTRPERITYIPGTASPAWNRSCPAGNRLTSPKRRMRSISAGERTGNIWWNREARAPLGVGRSEVPVTDVSGSSATLPIVPRNAARRSSS